MPKIINLQLFADNVETVEPGGDQVSVESSQETTGAPENSATEETAEPKGEEEESATPKQSKETNSFFKTMREKAEREVAAQYEDKLKEKVEEELKKFKDKLAPVLPDGYADVDEYLNSIDGDPAKEETDNAKAATQEAKKENLPFDESMIDAIVAKRIEAIPEIKALKTKEADDKKRLEKEADDALVVESFQKMMEKFPDIKKPEDVPFEVWGLWQEGKTGRSLISCMKEHRYDNDLEKAKQKGVAVAKGQQNSVSHTGKVNTGTGGTTEIDNQVQVPAETQTMMEKAGIPRGKWTEYYMKYHK